MDFLEIARARQSCRSYDTERPVEQEKLDAVLEAARLAPSACNAQPYHFTVCRGQAAKAAVAGVTGMGMNKFAAQAPVLIVISERPYSKSAALGSKVTKVDYRSICPRRACPNGWQAGREAGSTEAALRRWGEGQAAWRQSVLLCIALSWGSASFQIREPEHDFL